MAVNLIDVGDVNFLWRKPRGINVRNPGSVRSWNGVVEKKGLIGKFGFSICTVCI